MNGRWSKSDLDDYKKSQTERLRVYSKTDDVLYGMCKRWPNHKDLGIVQAKVRIIGRVYAAGLERQGKKDKLRGIYETIAGILHKKRPWIDLEIKGLNKFKTLAKPSYGRILSLHGNMVKILRDETRTKLNFRSFVSKYLHFHAPIVPLFDSRASSTINRSDWYPWRDTNESIRIPKKKEYDPAYYRFFMQFVVYFSDLQEQKLDPSVRSADWYLIWNY